MWASLLLKTLAARDRFEKKGKGTFERSLSWGTALEVAETNNDEVVGGDDEGVLPACAGHEVGLFGEWELPVAVEPEEATIDGTAIGLPGGGQGAGKADEPLGKNPLAVPDAVLHLLETDHLAQDRLVG